MIQHRAQAAQSKSLLDQKKAELLPQLYVRLTKPLQSSWPSYAQGPTLYFGVNFSTSAGFANQLQAQATASRAESAQELVSSAVNDFKQSIQVALESYASAKERVKGLSNIVKGTDLVLASYQRQFDGGRKTWGRYDAETRQSGFLNQTASVKLRWVF